MVEETSAKPKYTPHAIQLISLDVLHLHLEASPSSEIDDLETIEQGQFTLGHGHSEYDSNEKRIGVKLNVQIGHAEDTNLPFRISVELLGVFQIDESRFPVDKIDHWASHNAPLILYPYLREQVHALATKANFKGLLLPLFEVPSFRPV